MSKAKVLTGVERKALLLDVGAKLAGKYGAANVSRSMVAKGGKVCPGLVSHYFGSTEEARKIYARRAKTLGLEQPPKEKQIELGRKLRAHAPKDARDARPRSIKEVKAIVKKNVKPVAKKAKAAPETKPAAPKSAPAVKPASNKPAAPKVAPVIAPPANKVTAARAPKAPPTLPLPTL